MKDYVDVLGIILKEREEKKMKKNIEEYYHKLQELLILGEQIVEQSDEPEDELIQEIDNMNMHTDICITIINQLGLGS